MSQAIKLLRTGVHDSCCNLQCARTRIRLQFQWAVWRWRWRGISQRNSCLLRTNLGERGPLTLPHTSSPSHLSHSFSCLHFTHTHTHMHAFAFASPSRISQALAPTLTPLGRGAYFLQQLRAMHSYTPLGDRVSDRLIAHRITWSVPIHWSPSGRQLPTASVSNSPYSKASQNSDIFGNRSVLEQCWLESCTDLTPLSTPSV